MDKDKNRLTEQGQFKKIEQCWRIHTSPGSINLSSLLPIDFRTLHKKAYFHIAKKKKKRLLSPMLKIMECSLSPLLITVLPSFYTSITA